MADLDNPLGPNIILKAGQNVPPLNPLAAYNQGLQTGSQRLQLQQQANELALFPGRQTLQQQQVQQGALDLAQKQNQAAYSYIAPILTDPNVNHASLTLALAGAEASGINTDGVLAGLATEGMPGDGPGFAPWLRSHVGARMLTNPDSQLGALTASPENMSNGQQIQPGLRAGVLAPNAGAFTPSGPPIPLQTTPEFNNTPYVYHDASGRPVVTTQGQIANSVNGSAQGAPQPGQTTQVPFGNGGYTTIPSGLVPPGYKEAGGAPPAPSAPASIPVGPPPGTVEANTEVAKAAAQQFIGYQQSIPQTQTTLATLQGMEADSNSFPSGSTWWNEAQKKFANLTGSNMPNVGAYESFGKFANQMALQQGAGTDSRLNVASVANPNVEQTPAGRSLVLHQLEGNAQYSLDVAQRAAQWQQQHGSTDINTFNQQVRSQMDPRVWQYMQMSPQERATYLQGMTPQQRAALRQAGVTAQNLGFFGPATGGQ